MRSPRSTTRPGVGMKKVAVFLSVAGPIIAWLYLAPTKRPPLFSSQHLGGSCFWGIASNCLLIYEFQRFEPSNPGSKMGPILANNQKALPGKESHLIVIAITIP